MKAATDFYGGAPLDPTLLMKELDGDNNSGEDPEEQEYSGDEVISKVIIEDFRPDEDDDENDNDIARANNRTRRKMHSHADEEDDEGMQDGEDDGFGPADDEWDNWEEGSRPSGMQMADEDRNTNIFGILPRSRPKAGPSTVRPQDEFVNMVKAPEPKPTKKFTYETKAARRASTQKQKARRNEKASLGRSNKPNSKAKKSGKR